MQTKEDRADGSAHLAYHQSTRVERSNDKSEGSMRRRRGGVTPQQSTGPGLTGLSTDLEGEATS